MNQATKDSLARSVQQFRLPTFQEIPNVGLYLEQTAKYISEYLACLGDFSLTGSMISNYVKKKLIDSPEKKLYSREQIAYLIFIAVAKSAMSIENIGLIISLQKSTYSPQAAYDYFRLELENVLHYIFGVKSGLDVIGADSSDEKLILRNLIITVAHKVYLEKICAALQKEASPAEL